MVDIILHVLGALGMQFAFGIGLVLAGATIQMAAILAAIPAGGFWFVREYLQARGRAMRDGQTTAPWNVWRRTNHKEWLAPVAAVALVALVSGVAPAHAQQPPQARPECGNAALVFEQLRSQHGERIVARLKLGNGIPAVITANPITGTYTVIIQPEPNIACPGGSGEGFQLVPMPRDASI